MNPLAQGWEAVLDFLYPPLCVLCHERVPRGERAVCSRCWAKVERWEGEVPLSGIRFVRPVYAAGLYRSLSPDEKEGREPMREIIHHLKYRNKRSLSRHLGEMMAETLGSNVDWDAVLPVPLHRARKRERGYNQSDLLAREVGRKLGVPVLEKALQRVKNTKSQTGLEREERLLNVQGAFRVKDKQGVSGKAVLLVDDVTTTGATLEACGEALALAGGVKVGAVVAAWAQ
jgi:ComF family protein